jgi:ABC-type Mn2+/Zn2+ transport system permease subunit
MSSVLGYFKNSYSVVLLAIIISVLLTTISGILNGKELEKGDYIEGILLASVVSISIVYINTTKTANIEEVLTGVAPF